jgi:FkbM family methyltransferase
MQLRRLSRAEYLWQPAQLIRRAWRELRRVRANSRAVVRLPWGFLIEVDPRESIGRSIVALNALDLPVTEAIWRLLDEGETAVDIGANVGYMTSVMAARLARGGRVFAFEPMPELADMLRRNVARWASRTPARLHVQEEAIGDRTATAALHVPADFAENRGTASLMAPSVRDEGAPTRAPASPARQVSVDCRRLDDWAEPALRIGVMKVDVEGAELPVFRGAETLLKQRRIRDIVFEEHRPFPAESTTYLEERGYRVFRVTRGRLGPRLLPPAASVREEIDPPTYLATLEPERAIARFAPRLWRCLQDG